MVNGVIVKCMREGTGRNSFHWLRTDDVCLYKKHIVLKVLKHHILPINSRGDYKLHEDNFDSANVLLRKH